MPNRPVICGKCGTSSDTAAVEQGAEMKQPYKWKGKAWLVLPIKGCPIFSLWIHRGVGTKHMAVEVTIREVRKKKN